jgi:hypothetical protein
MPQSCSVCNRHHWQKPFKNNRPYAICFLSLASSGWPRSLNAQIIHKSTFIRRPCTIFNVINVTFATCYRKVRKEKDITAIADMQPFLNKRHNTRRHIASNRSKQLILARCANTSVAWPASLEKSKVAVPGLPEQRIL